MEKSLALNKLDRLWMSDTIRVFLEKLPIKSMKEIRQSHNIYEGSGLLSGNEILVQVKRFQKSQNVIVRNVIVRKPGVIFMHPLNNLDEGKIAADKFLQSIL